jgi:hypothetical protein
LRVASTARLLAVIGVAMLVAAGCANRGQPEAQSPAGLRPRSTATLTILEPAAGSSRSTSKVRVHLDLKGGQIVLQTSSRLAPDEGHLHLTLDGKLISMSPGLVSELEVSPGAHLLEVEYVANDHFPFSPRVVAVAPFTVK